MSTEARSIRLVALFALIPATAQAAEWRFLPSMDVAFYRDGNVGVVGSSGASDEVARVGVNFDLEWDTPSTATRLSYSPYREFYNNSSDLDYTAHNLSFDISQNVSRRSSFQLDLGGNLTDRQPIRSLRPDSTVTLIQRGKQINGYLDVTGRVGVGQRSFFDWGASGDLTQFPDDDTGTLTDTDSYGLSAGWGRELGHNSDIGGRVRGERLGFEVGTSTDVATLEIFFNHDFSRTLVFSLTAGAERSTTGASDSTTPRFEATLTHTLRGGSTLEGGLREGVSSAAGASSATLDRGVYVTLRPMSRSERFSAQVTAYYWTREAADSAVSFVDVETFEGLAALTWTPKGGHFALGGFYSYHDQTDATGSGPSVATSYSSSGVVFRWNFQGVRGVRS